MAELMSRCLALAEGVVTMVCPVLLALVLKKINWKDKVDNEPVVPTIMLLIAGATLLTGICPLLGSCLSEIFSFSLKKFPHVTSVPAHLSSTCLIVLACFISRLILPLKHVVPIGVGILIFTIMVLFILHSSANASQTNTAAASGTAQAESGTAQTESSTAQARAAEGRKEIQDILDKTHEFMSGITGILFLGLEVLALEGLISTCHGIPDAFHTPVRLSLFFCASGAFLMSLTMIYPLTDTTKRESVVSLTFCFDLFMIGGTVAIMTTIMVKLMGHKGFLLFSFPVLILFDRVYRLVTKLKAGSGTQQSQTSLPITNGSTPPSPQSSQGTEQQVQGAKVAPLGLTKVTFAGFWAMSVTTISTGSHNDWFLVVAATAITSGLIWRLLTHSKNEDMVKTANTASLCTHFNIAAATVLFTVMAWEAANKWQVSICARHQ